MRKIMLLALIASLSAGPLLAAGRGQAHFRSASAPVANRAGKFGVGVIIGNPSGLTGKYWFDRTWALSFEAGFPGEAGSLLPSFAQPNVGGSVDVTYHKYYIFGKRNWFAYNCPIYFGGGVWTYLPNGGTPQTGVRGDLGVTMLFPGSPFDVFVQASPSVRLTNGVGYTNLGGGLGGRYYF
jgi:hypothetical protein